MNGQPHIAKRKSGKGPKGRKQVRQRRLQHAQRKRQEAREDRRRLAHAGMGHEQAKPAPRPHSRRAKAAKRAERRDKGPGLKDFMGR